MTMREVISHYNFEVSNQFNLRDELTDLEQLYEKATSETAKYNFRQMMNATIRKIKTSSFQLRTLDKKRDYAK